MEFYIGDALSTYQLPVYNAYLHMIIEGNIIIFINLI